MKLKKLFFAVDFLKKFSEIKIFWAHVAFQDRPRADGDFFDQTHHRSPTDAGKGKDAD